MKIRRSTVIGTGGPLAVLAVTAYTIMSGAFSSLVGTARDSAPNLGSGDNKPWSQDQGAQGQDQGQDQDTPKQQQETPKIEPCLTGTDAKAISGLSGRSARHAFAAEQWKGVGDAKIIQAQTCIETRADAAKNMGIKGVDGGDKTAAVYMAFRFTGLSDAAKEKLSKALESGGLIGASESDSKPYANNDKVLKGAIRELPGGDVLLLSPAMTFREGLSNKTFKVGVGALDDSGSFVALAGDTVKIDSNHMPSFPGIDQTPKVAPVTFSGSFNGHSMTVQI